MDDGLLGLGFEGVGVWSLVLFLMALAFLLLHTVLKELKSLGEELNSLQLDWIREDPAMAKRSGWSDMGNMIDSLTQQVDALYNALPDPDMPDSRHSPPPRRAHPHSGPDAFGELPPSSPSAWEEGRNPWEDAASSSAGDPAFMSGFEDLGGMDDAWFDRVFREVFGSEEELLTPVERERYAVFKALNWHLLQRQCFASRFSPDNN
jgi:hypothetical protein